ncbi:MULTISPECIES: helix-turn-helix domain-containing protein [unclassified Enterococcus]|uniref:helix-turn-helix domain-containing protein n=1 Tax=unclassified Enterococcus TaxID=2608891 RepID=UPI001554FA0D|nr:MULTISPECIES: helix-turn-helix domain-containing protein [unclassified Enterococcus]MBS7575927.1 helix-turn-helix domain-containing protein [Enterococcus sp. MMGLQ5-2]MBS7583160.1 helix-turn-helix domain-containing protein [Enterococcus sp. MMGLQ5-1]NPD11020.1 helix-turn-helix domain-containing protein [Enterococcus sp. MMGLQ5-1]NPD35763.1 helix-turn-helix domain-containing protein [Enterococcus sp. MMGLQ5-2]
MFYNTYQLRKLELLHILDSENRDYTISELATQIGAANVTVKTTLYDLNIDLQRYNIPLEIQIKKSPTLSAYLMHEHNTSFYTLLTERYIKESITFQILNLLFRNKFYDVKIFAKNHYISTTLIYKNINEIRSALNAFNLKINLSSNNELLGSESQIRYFYILLYWEVYRGAHWPFEFDKKIAIEAVETIENIFKASFSIMQKEFYYYCVGVCIARISLNQTIKAPLFSYQFTADLKSISSIDDNLFNKTKNLKNKALISNEYHVLLLFFYIFDDRNILAHQSEKNFLERTQAIDIQLFKAISLYLNHTFYTMYKLILDKTLKDQLLQNGIKLIIRYTFFKGNINSFRLKKTDSKASIESHVLNDFVSRIDINRANKNLIKMIKKSPDFLNIYHHFLFNEIEKHGYLPKIDILLIWNTEDELALRKTIQNYAPCKIQFHTTLSPEKLDLVISNSVIFFPANVTSAYLINQRYSKRDILFLKQQLTKLYIEKIKKLFS